MPSHRLKLSVPQVRPHLANLTKLLLRIWRGHTRRHNHVLADLPINRSRHALLVTMLQRINDPQHFGRIPPRRSGIHHGQTDLGRGIDDEDAPDGEGDALLVDIVQVLLVDHVVQEGDFAVRVGDDGELDLGLRDVVDVLDPFFVGAEVVGGLEIDMQD